MEQIIRTSDKGLTVIRVIGVLDITTVEYFQETLRGCVIDRCWHIIVDLREACSINPMCLACLMNALKACRQHEGELVIVLTSDNISIKQTFRLTSVEKAFHFFRSDEEALNYLSGHKLIGQAK